MTLNEKHMTFKNYVFSMWGNCSWAKSHLERWDSIKSSESLVLCLWAQLDGGLVPTPVLWAQHADSTAPAVLWSSGSGSLLVVVTHMYKHATDCNQPPALRGGDQLAGNEAEKNWRMCTALWQHSANSNSCTHFRLPRSHIRLLLKNKRVIFVF